MQPHEAYWSRDASELMAELGASAQGLPAAEAAQRLRRDGPNAVHDQPRLDAVKLLLRQFESPLVLILVFGSLVALFVREWVTASIILVVVLGSALLGFVQEYRASVAVVSLGIPYLGPLAPVFDFVPLPWHVLGAVVAIVAAYVLSTEAAKSWFFRRG